MFGEPIEQIKRNYTDKLVLVDPSRPELARFRDAVGRVKTVNMNGRALVEFDEYHANIGWYDIALEYLKVVDQPPPKAPKPEAKKAPASKKAGEPASASASAGPKPGAKLSVAEMLAAARAGGAAGSAPAAPKAPAAAPAKAAAAPVPAQKAPTAAKSSERVDKSKMSIADMVAWCREHDTK